MHVRRDWTYDTSMLPEFIISKDKYTFLAETESRHHSDNFHSYERILKNGTLMNCLCK